MSILNYRIKAANGGDYDTIAEVLKGADKNLTITSVPTVGHPMESEEITVEVHTIISPDLLRELLSKAGKGAIASRMHTSLDWSPNSGRVATLDDMINLNLSDETLSYFRVSLSELLKEVAGNRYIQNLNVSPMRVQEATTRMHALAAPVTPERLAAATTILKGYWGKFGFAPFNGHAVIAGGFVEQAVTCTLPNTAMDPARDIDLFVYGEDKGVIEALIVSYLEKNAKKWKVLSISRTAITLSNSDEMPTMIQIIPMVGLTPKKLIDDFDLDCVAAYFDGNEITATPRAITAWETRANIFRPASVSYLYESRVHKYWSRGYDLRISGQYFPVRHSFDWTLSAFGGGLFTVVPGTYNTRDTPMYAPGGYSAKTMLTRAFDGQPISSVILTQPDSVDEVGSLLSGSYPINRLLVPLRKMFTSRVIGPFHGLFSGASTNGFTDKLKELDTERDKLITETATKMKAHIDSSHLNLDSLLAKRDIFLGRKETTERQRANWLCVKVDPEKR